MRVFTSLFLVFCFLFSVGQTTDANGKKQGYWKKTDAAGKLIYEGEFKDDKPRGKFKYYYPNDSVRAIMDFRQDGKVAYARLFHLNGKRMAEGKYINKEIRDSIWVYYDEAGLLISKDKFVQGKKNGTCYVYFPDGTVSEMRNYKDDLEEGEFKVYFDGVHLKSTGKHVKDKLDGRVCYYYPNGVEVAAGYYKNGKKTGPWIYKMENGKIKERELYVNGSKASKKETDDFFMKSGAQPVKKQPVPDPEASKKKQLKQPETSHE